MKNEKLHIWIALGVIFLFVYLAIFGKGSKFKGIQDMHFGIDIRGDAEAVFEPAGLEKKPALEELEMAGKSLRPVYGGKNMPEKRKGAGRK